MPRIKIIHKREFDSCYERNICICKHCFVILAFCRWLWGESKGEGGHGLDITHWIKPWTRGQLKELINKSFYMLFSVWTLYRVLLKQTSIFSYILIHFNREIWIIFFCIFYWRARVRWPLLCICRPFLIFEGSLHSNSEFCRGKRARYQLSHPSPIHCNWRAGENPI